MAEENSVVENQTEEKKTFVEWVAEHPKTTFAARAITWAVFACVLPFAFIAWRYGIFQSQGTIAISGWGMIAIIIAFVFIVTLLSYIKQGMKQSMLKQCLVGFCKVILPLLVVLLIVDGIKRNVALFEQALIMTITCEMIAIPINPFPEWLHKRQIEMKLEEQESVFGALWDKFFSKKKENGE